MPDRPYSFPDRLPGETDWNHALRCAAAIPADWILRKLLAHLVRTERRRRIPTWSLISDLTGHGCTISTALVEHYAPREEVMPDDHAPWVKLDMASQAMTCERCGWAKSIESPIGFAKLNWLFEEYRKEHSKCKAPKE